MVPTLCPASIVAACEQCGRTDRVSFDAVGAVERQQHSCFQCGHRRHRTLPVPADRIDWVPIGDRELTAGEVVLVRLPGQKSFPTSIKRILAQPGDVVGACEETLALTVNGRPPELSECQLPPGEIVLFDGAVNNFSSHELSRGGSSETTLAILDWDFFQPHLARPLYPAGSARRVTRVVEGEEWIRVTRSVHYRLRRRDDRSNYPLHLRAGEYFLVGDNVPVSIDSRDFGPVDREWIVGRVVSVLSGE